MATGRRKDDWWLMSHLLSLTANCHRDPKKPAYSPNDFNAMEPSKRRLTRGIPLRAGNIQILKVFLPRD